MQEIVYTGPSAGVALSGGAEFPRGTAVPIDDALAESLLRQSTFVTAADYQAASKSSTSATAEAVKPARVEAAPVAVEGVTA